MSSQQNIQYYLDFLVNVHGIQDVLMDRDASVVGVDSLIENKIASLSKKASSGLFYLNFEETNSWKEIEAADINDFKATGKTEIWFVLEDEIAVAYRGQIFELLKKMVQSIRPAANGVLISWGDDYSFSNTFPVQSTERSRVRLIIRFRNNYLDAEGLPKEPVLNNNILYLNVPNWLGDLNNRELKQVLWTQFKKIKDLP